MSNQCNYCKVIIIATIVLSYFERVKRLLFDVYSVCIQKQKILQEHITVHRLRSTVIKYPSAFCSIIVDIVLAYWAMSSFADTCFSCLCIQV